MRWEQPVGDYLEVAISHFSGLSREPTMIFDFDLLGSPGFLPLYEKIDQTGFESEVIYEGWIWKLEGITVGGQAGGRWNGFSTGLEYTIGDILGSGNDITVIGEYVRDSRENSAPTPFERDFAIGFRWAANDEQDTSGLFGVLYDPDTQEKVVSLEGSRRLGADWMFKINATFIIEKGAPIIDDNLQDAFNSLLNNPGGQGLEFTEEAKLFIVNLFFDTPVSELVALFNGSNNAELLDTLQSLQLLDPRSKLSILDNDDYVQLELVRYF